MLERPSRVTARRAGQPETGCIHVWTGEGKGKTSAAIGLALRTLGQRRSVFIGQFLKAGPAGEVAALSAFHGVDVEQHGHSCWLRERPRADCERRSRRGSTRLLDAHLRRCDVVILDETDVALACGLLTVRDCLELLGRRPQGVEPVLTGRCAPPQIVARADLVTEMREIRQYYDQAVTAREGAEHY